jgi:hypothetical protein
MSPLCVAKRVDSAMSYRTSSLKAEALYTDLYCFDGGTDWRGAVFQLFSMGSCHEHPHINVTAHNFSQQLLRGWIGYAVRSSPVSIFFSTLKGVDIIGRKLNKLTQSMTAGSVESNTGRLIVSIIQLQDIMQDVIELSTSLVVRDIHPRSMPLHYAKRESRIVL